MGEHESRPETIKDLPTWRPEEIEKIVSEVLEELLGGKDYDDQQVAAWTDRICEGCMRRLAELKKPYKFVVHATLVQRGVGSLHIASAGHFCQGADGVVTYIWPEERLHDRDGRGIEAAVQVFGFAF